MLNILLAKTGGILGPIANILGKILEWLYAFFSMIGIENVGLCIIVFTVVFKIVMLPLSIKQQKFSKMSTLMNPELQAVQKKYKDKRDQESVMKMQEETKSIYNKYGVSPSGSCLQMIIQMPILFAFYRVIVDIPEYVPQIKAIVESGHDGRISEIYNFFGINLIESPGAAKGVALLIPILSVSSQILSMKLSQPKQQDSGSENSMMSSMKIMMFTMPIVSGMICLSMPAGVGLYWVITSVVQIVQQLLINVYFNKVDINNIIKSNITKQNKKREKRGLPPQKVTNVAHVNTKNIEVKNKENVQNKKENKQEQIKKDTEYYNKNAKPGSLASKANMVQMYNEKNGKKKK